MDFKEAGIPSGRIGKICRRMVFSNLIDGVDGRTICSIKVILLLHNLFFLTFLLSLSTSA